jgi:iron(III) transport system substrate-binding protein
MAFPRLGRFVAVATLAWLAACGPQKSDESTAGTAATPVASAGEVNIYSARHYPADDQLFGLFTQETGIKVNIIQGSAEELMQRLKLEGEASPADVLITVDAGNVWRADNEKLFQPIKSDILNANIPANLRDPDGRWYAFSTRARIVVYDKAKVKPEQLSTYEDLADPKWKGQILIRSSNNIYNQSLLASIIANDGAEKAEAWTKGIVANMARKPEGADIEQIQALVAGEGSIAISNTYYFARLLGGKDEALKKKLENVGIFFPNQGDRGTHINISGAGVAVHAPNKANAIKLLEYLISPEAQEIFAQANYEFPVRPDAKPDPIVAAWGPFKSDPINVAALGEHNAEAVMMMDRAGWQ